MSRPIERLQVALGYQFQDAQLLNQALTHRSHGRPHNERLEFLGDSVLNFVVSTLLYAEHAKMDEGDLSRVRASLVKESTLADIGLGLNLPDLLRLGEGELKSGGFRRPSILADAVEALLGAVFVEGGYTAVSHSVERLYRPILSRVDLRDFGKDPKTLLQEVVQGKGYPLPQYTVQATHGAAHNQTFDVVCHLAILDMDAQASGPSRRSAEQAAAQKLLDSLQARGPLRRAPNRAKKAGASSSTEHHGPTH